MDSFSLTNIKSNHPLENSLAHGMDNPYLEYSSIRNNEDMQFYSRRNSNGLPPSGYHYITQSYRDGSVYEGEAIGGVKHGRGKLVYKDGTYYDGEWNQGRIEGFGILYYSNGLIAYEGEWHNSKIEGRGAMYNDYQTSEELSGRDSMSSDEKIWLRYEGEFANGKWHGKGRLFFTNGDEFYGEFKNDVFHGAGNYFTRSGESMSGEWRNNRLIASL